MNKKTSQLYEDFTKNSNEEIDEGYFFEVDVQQFKKLHEPHHDLPFLPERMKTEKFENMKAKLHDKIEYVIHIRNLKETLIVN